MFPTWNFICMFSRVKKPQEIRTMRCDWMCWSDYIIRVFLSDGDLTCHQLHQNFTTTIWNKGDSQAKITEQKDWKVLDLYLKWTELEIKCRLKSKAKCRQLNFSNFLIQRIKGKKTITLCVINFSTFKDCLLKMSIDLLHIKSRKAWDS